MKLLKLSVKALPNFKNNLDIDFMAQQRVDDNDKTRLIHLFSNLYTNPIFAFIGINASGKTTILKVLSFAAGLLNNVPVNSMESREILNDMDENKSVVFVAYFHHQNMVYKLQTVIGKKVNHIESSVKFRILDETLWSKDVHKIKTKKSIYDFCDSEIGMRRNQEEQYLMDDVSIMVAFNKKHETNLSFFDMSESTDYNYLNVLGKFPKEILTFLDPGIEYLNCMTEKKKVDIRLKFYDRNEIRLNSVSELNRYLSSGTIKGLSVFMTAVFAFMEGGYLIVDELENHFNKEIVSTLMRFFMDKNVNKKGAVLIFSTHYSQLLDEFERNDCIYIVKNEGGITAHNLSVLLKRNDVKKSEIYDSDYLQGTAPAYEAYIALKKVLVSCR